MSIYELFHYSLFPGLFLAFSYNKKEPPVFGATLSFWCILLSFFGLSFRHIPNNLSNYNVLSANAPFFYQISGTWSNHEGSILSWCRILSFYGFLLCYRGQPQSHNVSKRGGLRESLFYSFVSNFVKNSILSLPPVEQEKKNTPDAELRSRRNRTLDGTDPFYAYAQLYPAMKPMTSRGSFNTSLRDPQPLLHLTRDSKERAKSIDSPRIDGALGIALFFSPFLSASSDPFVRNFFVCTEPLAESNPVSQDPILAIHPPCIYAGNVASAMGFGLCRSKMMNGILALHSPTMLKDADQKNGRLFRSLGCVGSRITSELNTNTPLFFNVGRIKPEKFCILWGRRTRFFPFSSLWTGALADTGREQALRVVRNGKKDTTTLPLSWTEVSIEFGLNQVMKEIRIWILTCRSFLTLGILLGSWWAYHELGRGGWWFRDPVENASFMPRVLATACIHSVILPLLHSWTSFLNILTLPCCVSGTLSIRSGLLAPVHSFATDDTRGILLFWFLLLITTISILILYQMKQQQARNINYKKEMLGAKRTLVHLRNSAREKAEENKKNLVMEYLVRDRNFLAYFDNYPNP